MNQKTHAHGHEPAAQRQAAAEHTLAGSGAVMQEARPGEVATQFAPARLAGLDHLVSHSPRLAAQRRHLGAAFGPAAQREPAQPNLTGMPEGLKAGIESLSGMDMSDVRVHRNSSQPAQLNALAYAQGNDIHLGPGQEQHLPHEAWHVVQQAQGRVRPTMQMASGVAVNDDGGLEREADVMGGRAVQLRGVEGRTQALPRNPANPADSVAQRVIVSPPAEEMDLVIALAIFQMLVNKIDDKVVPLDRLGEVNLSGEAMVHVQGHGKEGRYEGREPLHLIEALESAKITFGPSVQLLLDYCYSAEGFNAFKEQLKDKGTSVTGNAGPAVTQDDGQHHSKPRSGSLNSETQQKFKEQCDKILESEEWDLASDINAKLVSEIAELTTIDPKAVATLIQERMGEAYKHVGDEYMKLYRLNEDLIEKTARQQIMT